MKQKTRIPADGEPIAWKSPFAGLKDVVLPPVPLREPVHQAGAPQPAPAKNRGRGARSGATSQLCWLWRFSRVMAGCVFV